MDTHTDDRVPERIKSGEIKFAKHTIIAFGLASDTIYDVTIDGKIELNQSHPHPEIFLNPRRKVPHPSYSKAWFYADCLAYDHDIPTILLPGKSEVKRSGYRYIHPGPRKIVRAEVFSLLSGDREKTSIVNRRIAPEKVNNPISPGEVTELNYVNQIVTIFNEIRELKHGPNTYILFRHYNNDSEIDLPYWRKYKQAAKEVHIYATALRHADTLSEYLWYYRIIESIAKNNGKRWIEKTLGKLSNHDFGFIPIQHAYGPDTQEPPINLLKEYQKRAKRRLNRLIKLKGNYSKISEYLYNVNRCGIAHGTEIIKGDLTARYFELVKDTYILKMLSRIAIDEQIN
jgi:hypothetical protein